MVEVINYWSSFWSLLNVSLYGYEVSPHVP